jgi:hypothetical protein
MHLSGQTPLELLQTEYGPANPRPGRGDRGAKVRVAAAFVLCVVIAFVAGLAVGGEGFAPTLAERVAADASS